MLTIRPPECGCASAGSGGNADAGILAAGWNGLLSALSIADESVATLIEDLAERGLLESALVLQVGEFVRTPKIGMGAK